MVSITQKVGTSPLTVWFLETSRVDGSSPTSLSQMQRGEKMGIMVISNVAI